MTIATATDYGSALLAAIIAGPADDLPRLAYADWLEEQGREPARAEFIRVQMELERLRGEQQTSDGRWQGWFCKRAGKWTGWHEWAKRCRCELCLLRRREYETSKRHCVWDWRLSVPPLAQVVYRRGFVASVRAPLQTLLDHGRAIRAAHPVEEMRASCRSPVRPPHHGEPGGFGWWTYEITVDEELWDHDPQDLPRAVWLALEGGEIDRRTTGVWRVYDSEQAALDDLSRVLLGMAGGCEWCGAFGEAAALAVTEVWSEADPERRRVRLCEHCRDGCAGG